MYQKEKWIIYYENNKIGIKKMKNYSNLFLIKQIGKMSLILLSPKELLLYFYDWLIKIKVIEQQIEQKQKFKYLNEFLDNIIVVNADLSPMQLLKSFCEWLIEIKIIK